MSMVLTVGMEEEPVVRVMEAHRDQHTRISRQELDGHKYRTVEDLAAGYSEFCACDKARS
jgi:hypothetical protein